jgi:hypothetical protein
MQEVHKGPEERLPTQQVERITTSDGQQPPLTVTLPVADESNRVASTAFVWQAIRSLPAQRMSDYGAFAAPSTLRPSAPAELSVALGAGALARLHGQVVQATGSFSQPGDAQVCHYQLRAVTNNAIQTSMSLDGQSGSVPNRPLLVPANTLLFFNVYVAALAVNVSRQAAAFHYEGAVRHVDDLIAFVEQPRLVSVFKDVAAWDARVQLEPISRALALVVQGEAAKLIRWLAYVKTVEVRF